MNRVYDPRTTANLIDLLLSQNARSMGKVSLSVRWSFSGKVVGPEIVYFDKEMKPLPDAGMRGFPRDVRAQIIQDFRSLIGDEGFDGRGRQVLRDGYLANRCELTVFPDRHHVIDWCFDSNLGEDDLDSLKSYLDEKEFREAADDLADYKAHKGRSKKWREKFGGDQAEAVLGTNGDLPKSSSPFPFEAAPEDFSPKVLFGTIFNTLIESAPTGWDALAIDGEVKTVADDSGKQLTDISADFQVRLSDGTVRTISPARAIAAMNALKLLKETLVKDDGTSWKRIRIVYSSRMKGSAECVFDQPGRWTG